MKKMMCVVIFVLTLLLSACGASSSETVRRVGRFRVGAAYDVYVERGYAYVANNDGIVILDVQRPKKPKQVGTISIGDAAFGIFVKDDLAYVAGSDQGVIIADVSDPANPKKLAEYYDGGMARQVRVEGSYAYVADGSDGLEILDVSDPSAPIKIAHFDGGGEGQGVEIKDGMVYFADSKQGIEVIDVTDPYAPQRVKTVPRTGGAWDAYVYGDMLYVGCHGAGVKIVSLAGGKPFQVVGTFFGGGKSEALGVWGDGETLYVADNQEGLRVLDVSDPTAPHQIGQLGGIGISLSPAVHDLFSDGKLIYLADGMGGLVIVEFRKEQ